MMAFYDATLVPILGVIIAVSMTAFLAHCGEKINSFLQSVGGKIPV